VCDHAMLERAYNMSTSGNTPGRATAGCRLRWRCCQKKQGSSHTPCHHGGFLSVFCVNQLARDVQGRHLTSSARAQRPAKSCCRTVCWVVDRCRRRSSRNKGSDGRCMVWVSADRVREWVSIMVDSSSCHCERRSVARQSMHECQSWDSCK
jgi:hypothetical protein